MNDEQLQKLAELLNQNYHNFDQRVTELEQNMTTLSNKTYERMDSVFKVVVSMRTEQGAHQLQHKDLEERIENL